MNDADAADDPTLEGDDSPATTGDSKSTGSTPDELSLARRRQAGAEAARLAEKARADALEAELAPLRAANQTAAQKDLSDMARLQAQLDAETKRADEADAKAEARVLDHRFPQAREKFPEITDEVRLAELQAFYATDVEVDPPTPLSHNEAKPSGGAAKKPESLADLEARVLASTIEPWTN